jgi:hypothetical protein
MDDDTIAFLRALCAKTKEVATLCEAYLEKEARKGNKEALAPSVAIETKPQGNRLIPITKWPEYHSWPSVGGLRHLIFFSNTSGADYFIRRAGRRVLICEKSFFEWVNMTEEQRIKSSPDASRYREKYKIR